jgi:purine-nucleoside phosphorylase
MSSEYSKIQESIAFIQSKTNNFKPDLGIILGTGLGALVDKISVDFSIDYNEIPNFPTSTVEFHKGKLIFGTFSGKKVVVMQGRFHHYEDYSMKQVVFPIRVLKFLGINHLFISNAAGGINPNFHLSDLMIITDHINLMAENPLTGTHEKELGDRWPDMYEAYNKKLISTALELSFLHKFRLTKGVYVGVNGPNLETPAEYKFLGLMGADAVGMSTVPEVIAAAQLKLPVFAVSVITDLCYPAALEPVSIEKIIASARVAEPKLIDLFSKMIEKI